MTGGEVMAISGPYLGELARQLPTLEVDSDGLIVSAGPQAAYAFGLPADQLVGRAFDTLLPPLDREPLDIREYHAGEGSAQRRRFRVLPLADPESGNRLLILLDDSDLHRARAECVNLTRMASAGRLIYSIVHEINNPLSGIIGYSQLLLMRELDPEVRGSLEKIFSEALRTSKIIRNLLDFSRRRASHSGRVRLGTLLKKALELKSHDLRVKNISVHVDVPESLPAIFADPHHLLQVFVNLVSNAEQAMYGADRGGRITLEAQAARDSVSLVLRDTGPGIPETIRDRVFEPFFTTKEEGQGTGLGLALCRDILKRQRASIQLLDSKQAGAAFLLVFQIYRAEAEIEPKQLRKIRPAQVRGRRIAVVEDDPVCRSLVMEAFNKNDNKVRSFDRSESALRYLRTHQVDVVISDLHRPGLNGMEFHEQVERFDPALASRILYLTGDTLNDELAAFLRRTGNPYLTKPVLLLDLFDAVQKLLARPGSRQKTLFSGEEGLSAAGN